MSDTLQDLHWLTCLDASPVCETDDCDAEATMRVRWACGCPTLQCAGCVTNTIAILAAQLVDNEMFECADCLRRVKAHCVADLIEVRML